MSVTSIFEYFVTLLSHADTFPLPENRIIILLEILNLGYLDCLNSCFLEMDILFQMKSIIIFLDLMHWKKLYLNRQSFRQRKNLIIIFFAFINAQLCRHYYKNNKYKTWRGYSVIAVDGSIGEAPYTNECFCMFGADIPNKKFNQAKTSPRISGFYDVLNELYIDVSITSFSNCFIRILWK